MSVLLEESSPTHNTLPLSHPVSHASRNLTERQTTRFGGAKNKGLRLDSPTTVQACKELGLLPTELKQKVIEDFKDPQVSETIVQLRFNHYMKRYNKMIRDVTQAKKRIVKKMKEQQVEQEQKQMSEAQTQKEVRSQTALPAYHVFSGAGTNAMNSEPRRKLLSTLSPMLNSSHNPLSMNFNRTVSYFKASHRSADIREFEDIAGVDETTFQTLNSPAGNFYKTFSDEISRFNKQKRLQQREANSVYTEEIRRIKMAESFREREKKKEEREKKLASEKKKKEEERKRLDEDKFERIKEVEKQFRISKQKAKEGIQKRFEEAKKKYLEELKMKRETMRERETALEMKQKDAEERRKQFRQEEVRNSDNLMLDINEKLMNVDERHQIYLADKALRMRMKLEKIDETVERNKEIQIRLKEEYVQKLVGKLVSKEEAIRSFRDQHYKELKKKEAKQTAQNERHVFNQQTIEDRKKLQLKEMNDRFKRVQENLEVKKKEDEENRKVKGEMNRLKIQDKLENHERLQRKLQFDRLKVLEKEKYEQEKVEVLKQFKEVAQKTKLEATIHAKAERDRIKSSVNQLSKMVYATNSSTNVTQPQLKLLKAILLPRDYQVIEDAEKQRDLERKIARGEIDDPSGQMMMMSASATYIKKR